MLHENQDWDINTVSIEQMVEEIVLESQEERRAYDALLLNNCYRLSHVNFGLIYKHSLRSRSRKKSVKTSTKLTVPNLPVLLMSCYER